VLAVRTLALLGLGAVLVACSTTEDAEIASDTAAVETPPSAVCPSLSAGRHTGFDVGGLTRSFEVLLPSSSFSGPRPLLFAWHGTGESGIRFINRAKLQQFADRGFVVIAPDAANIGSFWPIWDAMRLPATASGPNADVTMFDTLLGCAKSSLSIDASRVFTAGHSAGGIMVNHMLRLRSNVLAGGIAGSGVFDLTGPGGPPQPLDNLLVMVTWGGDNDKWSGATPGGVSVPQFSFVEQAYLASNYYSAQPNVDFVSVRGNNVGHRWLDYNDWYIDMLLAHPKGTPASHPIALADLPAGANAKASTSTYPLTPSPQIDCPSTARAGCEETCQLMADCAVENQTVNPALGNAIGAFGFTATSGAGCVQRCQQGATTAADAEVLSCITEWSEGVTCGGGIEGAFPMFLIMNQCCSNQPGSVLCQGICQGLAASPTAKPFFPVCASL
jgi:poly(3-hydroxybutyrate) depolymerase